MISGSQNAVLTMTSAATVSVRPQDLEDLRTGMAMTIAGTICMKISTRQHGALARQLEPGQRVGRRRGEEDHERPSSRSAVAG